MSKEAEASVYRDLRMMLLKNLKERAGTPKKPKEEPPEPDEEKKAAKTKAETKTTKESKDSKDEVLDKDLSEDMREFFKGRVGKESVSRVISAQTAKVKKKTRRRA